jgi:hypothetical protein
MSFLTNLETWFQTTEAEVLSVIVKIKNGIEYAEQEVVNGIKFLEGHAAEISGAVQTVAGVVGSLSGAGIAIPPSVVQAVKDANAAVAGLNAMVASQDKGTPQALVDGYIAAKQALAAANNATLAIAQAPGANQ